MKFQKLINFGAVVLLAISYGSTHAQEEVSVTVGETVKIPVPIKTDKICSLEITVGSEKIGRIAQAPAFVAEFDYKGIETGIVIAKWEGVIRFRGLNTTTACPGSGSIKISTLPNTEQLKKEWERIFSSLKPEQTECVRTGLSHKNVNFESIDPAAKLESPTSSTSKEVFSKCDGFFRMPRLWGSESPDDFPCNLSGGVKSRCSGVYAERGPDGRLAQITKATAIQYQMDGKAWTTGQRETEAAKQGRERLQAEEKAKKDAEELAKREAAELDRKFKESPEYKRQQAEIERNRIAEQKAAEERERKEKVQAEIVEKQKRAAEEKRQIEIAERQKQERLQFAKNYPYYALITCGFRGQHINIIACFAGRTGTEIELKNGSEYGLYKAHEIGRLGQETREGFIINLKSDFNLKAQNSHDTLVLGVKIIDRTTDGAVFEKQVARFGMISIKN